MQCLFQNLRVGPFTVIVGANASGKSNIRDAFRFLHGIGRGYTLAEIIGGKYGAGGQSEWEPIRGAADEIIHFGQPAFILQIKMNDFEYLIEVSGSDEASPGLFRVTREELKHRQWWTIHTSRPGRYVYTSHLNHEFLGKDDYKTRKQPPCERPYTRTLGT